MDAKTCCTQPKEQKLYMLELLVDRLNLSPEKIREIGSTPLSVSLDILDFPTFQISEEEWSANKEKEKQNALSSERKSREGNLDFSAGHSCLFPMKPSELVEKMRVQPLKIGVYRATPKAKCGLQIQETPICKSELPLAGCLCDQVAMAANDDSRKPKPYILRNTWNLIDEQGVPSGTILLFLRLTCLGKSVVTQFAVKDKTFLFKSSNSLNEFQCSRIPLHKEELTKHAEETQRDIHDHEEDADEESDPTPKPQSVIGLAPICQELVKRDGGPLEVVPPLELPTQRVIGEKPASRTDVVATSCDQKLVSSRQLCSSLRNKLTEELPCGDVVRTNNPFARSRINDPRINIQQQVINSIYGRDCCFKPDRQSGRINDCTLRTRGGGRSDGKFGKARSLFLQFSEKNLVPPQSVETLISGACRSNKTEIGSKPGCGCFGKSGTGLIKNGLCANKPCEGVDCMIRAFKETQDFVDSIGRVPGLAGLGLMDPSESPFFGRERSEALTSCMTKSEALPSTFGRQASSLGHAGHEAYRKLFDRKLINTILPAPGVELASSPFRDANVLQADLFPVSTKSKKKLDEKNDKHRELQTSGSHQNAAVEETSRCGAPQCASRKRKLSKRASTIEQSVNSLVAEKKLASINKSFNSRRKKIHGKSKSHVNLNSEYRSSTDQNSCIKVSRGIMKLVSAIGDPRFCHGHKNCLDIRLRVPSNMGWLWNTGDNPGGLKSPIGWKPGAISKYVWDRLQEAKIVTQSSTNSDSRPVTPSKLKRGKSSKSIRNFYSVSRSPWTRNKLHESNQEVELPPTLHIHRKDGTYYVTMYPVKSENTNDPEQQEKVKPLQFKVTKNKDDSVQSSSSASDMEIEFSPPAAINRYKKAAPRTNQDTQVNQQEILESLKVSSGNKEQGKKSKKAKIKK